MNDKQLHVYDMEISASELNRRNFYRDSLFPLAISAIPMLCFAAMGLLFTFFILDEEKPKPELPEWFMIVALTLQTIGTVGIAVFALVRLERGQKQLNDNHPAGPPVWKRVCLLFGIFSLTVFEVITNIASAFGAHGFLLIGAAVFYLTYLVLIRSSTSIKQHAKVIQDYVDPL